MKKEKKNFKRLMGYSITMGGAGLIGAKLPAVAGAPVKTVATTGSAFVAPMSAIVGAGYVVKTLKHLNPKKKRR